MSTVTIVAAARNLSGRPSRPTVPSSIVTPSGSGCFVVGAFERPRRRPMWCSPTTSSRRTFAPDSSSRRLAGPIAPSTPCSSFVPICTNSSMHLRAVPACREKTTRDDGVCVFYASLEQIATFRRDAADKLLRGAGERQSRGRLALLRRGADRTPGVAPMGVGRRCARQLPRRRRRGPPADRTDGLPTRSCECCARRRLHVRGMSPAKLDELVRQCHAERWRGLRSGVVTSRRMTSDAADATAASLPSPTRHIPDGILGSRRTHRHVLLVQGWRRTDHGARQRRDAPGQPWAPCHSSSTATS